MDDSLPNRDVFSAHMRGFFDEGPSPLTVFVRSVLHINLEELRELVKNDEIISLINHYNVLIYLVNPPQARLINVTPLEKSQKRTAILEILLKAGANPNITFGTQNSTPLHFCCNPYYMDSDCVNVLLGHDAIVTLKNANGNTALHDLVKYPVTSTSLAIAKALLKKDVSVKSIMNNEGETPFACKFTHYGGEENELSDKMEKLLSTDVFDEKALDNAIRYGYSNSVIEMCDRFQINNKKYVKTALSAPVPNYRTALLLQERLPDEDKIIMTEPDINHLFERVSMFTLSPMTAFSKDIKFFKESFMKKSSKARKSITSNSRQSRRETPYGGVGRRKRTSKTQKRKSRR